MTKLNKDHAKALLAIKKISNIFGLGVAMKLREVEKVDSDFITIAQSQGGNGSHDRLPYFSAVATDKGIAWAKGLIEEIEQ